MAASPYVGLPDHRFWRKAVAEMQPSAVDPIIDLPFKIHPQDKVATGGSCFAQHIAKRLQGSGLQYYQVEQPPAGMSDAEASERGYGMYSCRYGNIYTTRQLLQLFDRALGIFKPALDWWQRPDGRYVDPFRPRIEPDGFATVEDMHADRDRHLVAVRTMFQTMDVFLFTFGLTESWVHKEDGAVLQLAPGVAGGEWDPARYAFWNARASEVASDYLAFADKLRVINPKVRLIVSVSPVPIIATYMPRHALVSNSASKSTLRVACDEVVAARPEIAYFPSYDLVSFGPNAGRFYKENLRELNAVGLSAVMRAFFTHFAPARGPTREEAREETSLESAADTAPSGCRVLPVRPWGIRTPRQLLQLFDRVYGLFWPQDQAWIDEHGAFIDPFRPCARRGGFASLEDLETDRDGHFAAVKNVFEADGDLVLTFESAVGWEASSDGAVFPSPPPFAQSAQSAAYRLRRYEAEEMAGDVHRLVEKLRRVNPHVRLVFAVSPPATAYGDRPWHDAEVSDTATLRVVADRIVRGVANTALVPACETVTGLSDAAAVLEDDVTVMSRGDIARAIPMPPAARSGGADGALQARAEGDVAAARTGFDAEASIMHLQTVICDEVAIEQSLQP